MEIAAPFFERLAMTAYFGEGGAVGGSGVEFQIVLDHPSPYEELSIIVEHGPGIKADEMEGLKTRLAAKPKEELNFKAVLTLVPSGSIKRTEMGKARRVVRN